MKALMLLLLLQFVAMSFAAAESDYAGEQSRAVKSLSPGEIAALRAGKGMGFAKTAELNGYPGPRHVLDLADELELTEAQRVQSEAIFSEMKAAAVALGEALIRAESELDQAFADHTIDMAVLEAGLLEIGDIRARLRLVHMAAHLKQAELLSEAQIKAYSTLRGYTD